jgi:transposase-like protein
MTCPNCGSDGYGPIDAGVDVCPDCGYDSEHKTPAPVCPGCGSTQVVMYACAACRDRVPTDLPGHQRWRTKERTRWSLGLPSLGTRAAVVDWLTAHPKRENKA